MENQNAKNEPPQSNTKLKTYFITGLVILLPLALTLAIVSFIFNLLTEPFVGIVKSLLGGHTLLQHGFLFLSPEDVQILLSRLIILVLLFFFTVGLGMLTRWFFIHSFIRFWEYIVARIPFVRSVYKTSQDVIQTLFSSGPGSFKQVVLVPFPSEEAMAVGFVTREQISLLGPGEPDFCAVFVPTTPNPTSGFLMMFKTTSLMHIDMKVEDALKFVISCGMINMSFNRITKEQALEIQSKKST